MPDIPIKDPVTVEDSENTTADEVKELTQTDHLNKKLLSSLLERLNTSNSLDRYRSLDEMSTPNTDNDEFSL